jgi:DNA polymerase-3 subunit epsilon
LSLFGGLTKPAPTVPADRGAAVRWASRFLAKAAGKALILDTETCDLHGEVIELAILQSDGAELYNRRFRPLTRIAPRAFAVHGISDEMLRNEAAFARERLEIQTILGAADVVAIYNAPFDKSCLARTCVLHNVAILEFKEICLMRWYAVFYGERLARGGYKTQPLAGEHSAVGDCQAALRLLQTMAEG